MNTERIIGRQGGRGSHNWTSRDYNVEIPCARVLCPANARHNKPAVDSIAPTCGMASAIKIGANGICKTGEDLIRFAAENPRPKPDGD